MDRRERAGDPQTALMAALDGLQSLVWTAMPGIVVERDEHVDFDAGKMTCTVQPAIQAQVQAPDGTKSWVTLPLLVDCPVCFPGGGGFTLTVPLQAGDEVLVVFSSRCIDAWWQNGGVQNQPELRMHDLSDGFAIPGIRSLPRVVPNISSTAAQLRNDAGTAVLSVGVSAATLRSTSVASVEAPLVMLGTGPLGDLSDLAPAPQAIFDDILAGGFATFNPVGAVAATLESAVTAPSLAADLAALELGGFITGPEHTALNNALGIGLGVQTGLLQATQGLTEHTDLLSGVATTLLPAIPSLDRVVGLAGGLGGVVGGAFGDPATLIPTVTSALTSSPAVVSATAYVNAFCAQISGGLTTPAAALANILARNTALNAYVSSDTTNYNNLQGQVQLASGFIGSVALAQNPSAAVSALVDQIMTPANQAALQSVNEET